ncbi:MAG: glycosyltransferase family 39 protein [Elusimicrobia bacterium]|nr:glycosyltransferase family 39 protein [Elusimicrobiota bacterium]
MKKLKKPPAPVKEPELRPVLPALAVLAVLGVWGWAVVSNYSRRFPFFGQEFQDALFSLTPAVFWYGFLQQFLNIALAAWVAAAAFGTGLFILGRLKIAIEDPAERFVFAEGLGLVVLTYLTYGLGFAGLLYKGVFYAVLAALTPLLFLQPGAGVPSLAGVVRSRPLSIVLFLLTAATVLLNFVLALSPEFFYDSLVYHLAVPQYYILSHRIVNMPQTFFSSFPLNMEMLYLVGLLLGDSVLAKLLQFLMGAFSAFAVYAFAKKYFNRETGVLAAAIFYSMPMAAICSRNTGTELGVTLFQLLGFWALYNYLYSGPRLAVWLIFSGIFSGMACGMKYTGVFSLAAIMALLALKLYREGADVKCIAKKVALTGFAAGLLLAPILIKNYAYTKNPVHPYLSGIFGRVGISDDKMQILMAETSKRDGFKFGEYLKLPWDQTMNGNTDESFCGPVFLLFLPLLFLFRNINPKAKYLAAYFALMYLMWSGISYYLRYFLPGLAVLSLLTAYFLVNNALNKYLKGLLLAAAALGVVVNFYWSVLSANLSDRLPVVDGRETKDSYLGRGHVGYPSPYYKTIVYMNANLDSDAKVLFIGENRGYYSERLFVAGAVHDDAMILRWIKGCRNEDELYAVLGREKITHLLVNLREGTRVQSYKIYTWDARELKLFNRFWKKYVKDVHMEDDVYLYRLAAGPAPAPVNTVFLMYLHDLFSVQESGGFNARAAAAGNLLKEFPEAAAEYSNGIKLSQYLAYFDGLMNMSLLEYAGGNKAAALQLIQFAMRNRPDQKKYFDQYMALSRTK